jgi:hypothetical protein
MAALACRLPCLEQLVLCFNNPAQQFESGHLRALAPLTGLVHLTLVANFHPEACSFAPLSCLPRLAALAVMPSDASTGLTDAHVASLAGLTALEELTFPGHARAFTGATLAMLAGLPRLRRLAVTSRQLGAVDYSLALPAMAGVRALTRRQVPRGNKKNNTATAGGGNSSTRLPPPPLELELGVPDAGMGASLLRAAAGPGLAGLTLTVRDAAGSDELAALCSAPGAATQLAGLDLEFRAAPGPADVAAIARCKGLRRLHLSCKCPRAPAASLDWTPWLGLRALTHLHLHINPAWRAPLQPAALGAMAAAWPGLQHLHLRLGPGDNASHALRQLPSFSALTSLSLTWLGQAGPLHTPAAPPAGGGVGAGGAAAAPSLLRRRCGGSFEGCVLDLGCLPPRLSTLSLTSIATVRLSLPGPAGLPALRQLSLDGVFGVDDALLAGLVDAAPRLAGLTLVLTGRQGLSGAGLRAAAPRLPRLRQLHVSDYREAPLCLSQGALAGLADAGLAALRGLKLSTPDVVHAQLSPDAYAGLTKLRRLDLVGAADAAASALGRSLPLCCIKHSADWAPEPVGPDDAASSSATCRAAAAAAQQLPPPATAADAVAAA